MNRLLFVLPVGAVAGLFLSLWFMFSAGCAGDLKGGSIGNPLRALELEGYAVILQFVGLLLGSAYVDIAMRKRRNNPIAYAAIFFVAGFGVFSFFGWQLEAQGVQSCF